jgi:hypothetical protein
LLMSVYCTCFTNLLATHSQSDGQLLKHIRMCVCASENKKGTLLQSSTHGSCSRKVMWWWLVFIFLSNGQ